jgi:hypothetical protein
MKKTPESISRARQQAGVQAKVWRAGIADARASLALYPEHKADIEHRVTYAQAQIAEIAKELKALRRKGKKPFWK